MNPDMFIALQYPPEWRSAVDTENLPVNLPVELAQVRKKSTFFI